MSVTRIPGTLPEHLSRDEKDLAADISEEEMSAAGDRWYSYLTQDRWVVDGLHVKPQYMKSHIVTVWSPCCGRPRKQIEHGYAFSCPACGWWWRYHCLGWTNRFVSLGKEKPE